MSGVEDSETTGRSYGAPYTSHHPVPSIQKYKEERHQREAREKKEDHDEGPSRTERAKDAIKFYKQHEETPKDPSQEPYRNVNKNLTSKSDEQDEEEPSGKDGSEKKDTKSKEDKDRNEDDDRPQDTSQIDAGSQDPKEKRKQMKNREKKSDGGEREVTDPVTHLPVKLKDFTGKDLKKTPTNEPPPGTETQDYERDHEKSEEATSSLEKLFPPPDFELIKRELQDVHKKSMAAGLSIVSVLVILSSIVAGKLGSFESLRGPVAISLFVLSSLIIAGGAIWSVQQYSSNKINDVWENHVWEAERQQGKKAAKSKVAESTQWLNSLLGAVWPLINPDLFTSLVDTLEVSHKPLSEGRCRGSRLRSPSLASSITHIVP